MFQSTLGETTWQMGRNSVAILRRAPLPYLLITMEVINWKKSLLVIYKTVRHLVYTLTADNKHYLLNRDKLKPGIQMQLSQQEKGFSKFF